MVNRLLVEETGGDIFENTDKNNVVLVLTRSKGLRPETSV